MSTNKMLAVVALLLVVIWAILPARLWSTDTAACNGYDYTVVEGKVMCK